jgi:MHS family alpha-ketoglutarate permease-like MFS transporter
VTGIQDEPLDLTDVRRRLSAIFVGSVGNLVRVVRLLRLRRLRALLRQRVLSRQRSGRPAAERRDSLRVRLHRQADWRLAVRPPRHHYGRRTALMLSVLLMCFGSLMIAVTPTYASIGVGARPRRRPHDSGPEPRR